MGPMNDDARHTEDRILTAEEAAIVFALPPYPPMVRIYTEAPDDAFAALGLPVPRDAQAQRLLADLFRAPAHTAQEVVRRYDAACAQAADAFARYAHLARRLHEGTLLEPATAAAFRQELADHLDDAVAAFARRGATEELGWLFDAGAIGAAQADRAIEVASRERGLAAVAFLLREKRARFGGAGKDLAL